MEFDTTPLLREIELLCRGWLVQQANLRVLVPRSLALYRQVLGISMLLLRLHHSIVSKTVGRGIDSLSKQ